MLKLPPDRDRTWGKWKWTWGSRGGPFADFELLRYPVYVPIVRELAEKGDVRGMRAMDTMCSPEATQALLELANHKTPAVASKAQKSLLARMPAGESGQADRFAGRAWRPDFNSRVVQLGWNLLATGDCAGRIRGGQIIGALGGKDDLPKLIEAMDKLLPAPKDNDVEQPGWYDPETVCVTLLYAAEELIGRGATPPTTTTTPGQAAAFLAGLEASKDFRPPGWQQTVTALLKHEIPYLRAQALQEVPLPLSDAAAALVAARIRDDYAPAQEFACELAGKSKLARFRQPLIAVVRTTSDDSVLQAAFEAARACGADVDRLLEILVGRLERRDENRNDVLLRLLIDAVIEGGSNDYYSGNHGDWQSFLGDMQKAWRGFIDANRQALREGKKFKIGKPPLRREMFPPGDYFNRPGQPPWPEQ
jgi:hypothetical protein